MATVLDHINNDTPMGANLLHNGASFRVWAPNAKSVYITGDFNSGKPEDGNLLNQIGNGHWAGFVPGVSDRQQYMFYIIGNGDEGPKRDPYARELVSPFPDKCVIRDPYFPWHETGYQTPQFADFVIYQLHVGVFHAPRLPEKGAFLDVIAKIPYLKDLGVTVLQLLPIQEYSSRFSRGYNNVDFYSPEMDFAIPDMELPAYLEAVNAMLVEKGLATYLLEDLKGEMNQLKALVDLCHIYGLGVMFDVVYNHAGGDFGTESLYFLDRQPAGSDSNSLYFIPGDFVGGLIFDYSKPEVRDFLINNAKFFLDEYRIDGFRFDEVSTIDHRGQPFGWSFCKDLTSTLKFIAPNKLYHAEYWGVNPLVVQDSPVGIGFNTSLTDGLRIAIRDIISNAAQPDARPLNMDRLAESMWPAGFSREWQFVQGPENHDVVHVEQEQRIAHLADPSDARSWYATSRSRVAMGITLTAPGIPMLFMGQEFLEDKQWSEDFSWWPHQFIYWEGLSLQKKMADFLRFTRELIALRWQHPGLRAQGFSVIHTNNSSRVMAFHRWVDGIGKDVMVILCLANSNQYHYKVGFPHGGFWQEVFNSDVYENWVNPDTCGNGGGISADAGSYDGCAYSATLQIPANGILVFARQ
ncbi:alpha amylase C-terminal domain-containing protein [Mucilaginibacter sp. OK283]|jgi:1,4-alpha-glucan branching enzyme|uniref:alpha amylase C-terminal domain-containing protein n=1 Tax=Mucilaginibacter sp. OK283 TaxID=1881049 RepID=UPI0008C280C3|nr:alpha amylase C-terminal domain-containing protein [Mucilaginibacter sp. OK283]SEO78787.1 1,4-alpha-glucan branching enzyme [Mucilaginibacter sp. OK283]